MIYHLFQWFEKSGWDFPGANLMHYISFRVILASVMAVLFALIAGKGIIGLLQKKQIGETIRDLGLEVIETGDPDGLGDLKRLNQIAYRLEIVYSWAVIDPAGFAVLKSA